MPDWGWPNWLSPVAVVVVDADVQLHGQPTERLADGQEVGCGTDLRLQPRVDLVHNHRVHAHAGHHGEVLRLGVVDGQPDQVDGPGLLT